MASTASAERSALRSYLQDGPTDRLVRGENVGTSRQNWGFIKAGATVFSLLQTGIVTASVKVRVDDADYRTFPGAGESLDEALGQLTFTDATKPKAKLRATYYWQEFDDTDIDTFLASAIQWLETYWNTDVDTSVPGVPEGLLPAVKHFAASEAFGRLYTKYGELYDATAEGRTASKSSVPQRFKEQAKDELAAAEKMRDDFWDRSGRKSRAALRRVTRCYPSWTPRR